MEASLSHATVERYLKLFAENDLAGEVFHRVTSALIEALELDVSRQRLDSTHIFSDMATFGRTKLMGVTIKRFLIQLKRHHPELHGALDMDLLARYAPSQAKLFGDGDRRARVVAGDHLHRDARLLAVLHGANGLSARRVDHALQSEQRETARHVVL
jgi:hypothetical protein